MSTAFNVIATLIAKPGQQATLETLLRGLLEPTRLEPGCEQYDLHQDLQHPETFYMLERWSDDAALADHDQSAHIQAFRSQAAEVIEHFELKRLKFLA
ncbi:MULTISPECIES: putative quinol monooxygenase [Pseudomonas fluorescens group]|uniref:Antibiotic biosynthesis monooxygenase n=1 Tax=Pseudomonas fluorescens TaxID=294 RepID=A0AAE2U9I4_PSEFL|nr:MULTISPECIES: putative quinol monooxygenase [Pseudomonas fluorescens group]MBA1430036.1 antibiotic biosynthesis monooxygenase [Pseudomonas orientalis]MBD8273308.1 antibiotic biosynthesis monooxygenase [Pseudomonas fluorescens]MDF2793749.1 antibiotic biosynthesis monooxygenase [Pseudomonas orientalis]UOB24717.1 antibiotic biosynthesis monooxygenase [Pseudomonas orientalis]